MSNSVSSTMGSEAKSGSFVGSKKSGQASGHQVAFSSITGLEKSKTTERLLPLVRWNQNPPASRVREIVGRDLGDELLTRVRGDEPLPVVAPPGAAGTVVGPVLLAPNLTFTGQSSCAATERGGPQNQHGTASRRRQSRVSMPASFSKTNVSLRARELKRGQPRGAIRGTSKLKVSRSRSSSNETPEQEPNGRERPVAED
ncbi:MAG: hypothetical protein MZV70_07995 [Desulfobacterales bacterium]|nr:hypothetical protein [Desulfobacterales bacterium]